MTGECWNRFERKTLLTFTGYKDRYPVMMKELYRIGMQDVHVQWQFPNPFENVFSHHLRHKKGMSRPGYMNCTMGHYAAVKRAFELGVQSCLVMEDDIAFLSDATRICATVASLPDDFDIAMFDWFPTSPGFPPGIANTWRSERSVNECWAEFDALRSCGCYALSRKGMARYIWLNEAVVTDPSIGMMRVCDQFFERRFMNNDMHMYFAKQNVAIQRKTNIHNSNFDLIEEGYAKMGIDRSMYGA